MISRRRVRRPQEIRRGLALAGQEPAELEEFGLGGAEFLGDIIDDDLRVSLRDAIADSLDAEKDGSKVLLEYRTQADERVRPHHAALHGTIWKVDDPERPAPPLGFGCRCWMEPVAADERTARRTGLPQAPANPPKPGSRQALERFFSDARRSDSPTTPVTPTDTFGPQVGKLMETGDVDWDAVIDDDGNPVRAAIIRAAAGNGGSVQDVAAIERARLRLQGMGLNVQQAKQFASEARELAAEAGISPQSALAQLLQERRPGFIGSRKKDVTAKRAERASGLIRQMFGGDIGPADQPARYRPRNPAPDDITRAVQRSWSRIKPGATADDIRKAMESRGTRRAMQDIADAEKQADQILSKKPSRDNAQQYRAQRDRVEKRQAELRNAIHQRIIQTDQVSPSHIAADEALRERTREARSAFVAFVNKNKIPQDMRIRTTRRDRSYANPKNGVVALASHADTATAMHELGHLLESDPSILRKVRAFFARRTAGESLQKLSDVTGIAYRPSEVCKRDKFFNAYCGRVYSRSEYTEILSMGLERLWSDPVGFAADDPEYMALILDVIA